LDAEPKLELKVKRNNNSNPSCNKHLEEYDAKTKNMDKVKHNSFGIVCQS
jgi:hypothetical protein